MLNKTIYALGEPLLRLETKKTQSEYLDSFKLYYGGAEFNVLVGLSGLKNKTSMISILPNNFIGSHFEMVAKRFDIETNKILKKDGNMGIYFLEKGTGSRVSSVSYNRKYSAFMQEVQELEKLDFGKEGDWIHLSGITISLSEKTFNTTLKLLNKAKAKGMKISFDFNYRSKLISYAIAEKRYMEVLKLSDLIFATRKDFTLIFKWDANMSNKEIYQKIFNDYDVEWIANSTRKIEWENHMYEGNLFTREASFHSGFQKLNIVDRIGGGDSFAAGIINGLSNNKNLKKTLMDATYQAVICHSINGDYAFIREKEINEFVEGKNKDVKR